MFLQWNREEVLASWVFNSICPAGYLITAIYPREPVWKITNSTTSTLWGGGGVESGAGLAARDSGGYQEDYPWLIGSSGGLAFPFDLGYKVGHQQLISTLR